MQENMWARLRDSRPGACLIHATLPTYFPAFLYMFYSCHHLLLGETIRKSTISCISPKEMAVSSSLISQFQ